MMGALDSFSLREAVSSAALSRQKQIRITQYDVDNWRIRFFSRIGLNEETILQRHNTDGSYFVVFSNIRLPKERQQRPEGFRKAQGRRSNII